MIAFKKFVVSENHDWLTFVHGAGGSSSIWFKQLRYFLPHYNILLLDLRGHGESAGITKFSQIKKYTFDEIAQDVIEVMDYLKIKQSHFVGISMGSIVIRKLAEMHTQRVQSMVLGGAVMHMNLKSKVLIVLGNIFKHVIPYMMLYKLYAHIILPRKNHRDSRNIFIQEAKKLYQKEFIRWFRLTTELGRILKFFRQKEISVPTLYIMGSEDHMFLPSVKEVVSRHISSSSLHVIEGCGHVVNIEKPLVFNQVTLRFIQQY